MLRKAVGKGNFLSFVSRFGQDTKNVVMFVALNVASNVFEILAFAVFLLKLSPNLDKITAPEHISYLV